MGARLTVARAAAREHLSYDLGPLGLPSGMALLAASRLLRVTGRRRLGFDLLLKSHNRALSPVIDRQVDSNPCGVHRSGAGRSGNRTLGGTSTPLSQRRYPPITRIRTRTRTGYLGSTILVVKTATPRERGVIVADYQYVFPLLAGLFDLGAICDRYDVVLEPSWADVCAPEVLLFTRQDRPIYVQTIEPRDREVLSALDTNLRVVPLAANWWVDPRRAPASCGVRDIDVIMVAAWADIKRHWRVFRALSELRRRGRKLRTALVGYRYDRTREEIEGLAAHFGIRDQVETYERISQDEVSALLAH